MHPFQSEPHDRQTGTEQSLVRRIIDSLFNLGSNHYGRCSPRNPDETDRDRNRRIADKAQAMIDFLYAEYPGVAPRPRPPTVSPADEVLRALADSIARGGKVSRAMEENYGPLRDGVARGALTPNQARTIGGLPEITVNNLTADQGVTVTGETDAKGNVSGDVTPHKFVRSNKLRFGRESIYAVTGDNVSMTPIIELVRGTVSIIDPTDMSTTEKSLLVSALRWYATVLEKEGA